MKTWIWIVFGLMLVASLANGTTNGAVPKTNKPVVVPRIEPEERVPPRRPEPKPEHVNTTDDPGTSSGVGLLLIIVAIVILALLWGKS